MGVRIQELPETTGINKEDLLIVEDGQGTKKGTVQQLDDALGVSQLKEDLVDLNFAFDKRINNYQSRKILDLNGDVSDIDADYIVSDFINCQLFKYIFIKYLYYGNPESYQICFYDLNKTFISGYRVPNKGVNENIDINIPTEAVYFRFSCESTKWEINLKNFNLNVDSTLELNIPANAKKIGDLMSETYRTFKDTSLTIKNKYIDKNGTIRDIADTDTYHISEYINCTTFRKLFIKEAYLGANNLLVAFYDRNKEFLEGTASTGGLQTNVVVTVPNVAYYMVLSSKVDDANYTTYLTEIGFSSNIYDLVSILENKKVVFLGDSITAGQGSSTYVEWTENKDGTTYRYRGNGPNYPNAGPDYVTGEHLLTIGNYNWYESLSAHGWAQKLKGYLMDKFNCTVHNRACAGIYSKELRDNFERWSAESDIVFIMIGTNDRSNASIETCYSNLEYILKVLLSQSKIPVLLTSIPASVANEEKQGQKYHMEDVAIVINRLSNKYNLTHYSFFNDIQRYCDEKGVTLNSLLSDGLHPDDNGYNVMFRLLCYGLNIPLKIENATW